MPNNKQVLILGGAGFLGANLVRFCLNQGAVVTVVDSLEPKLQSTRDTLKSIENDITFIQGDIRDAKLLKEVVPGKDVIFNCVAQTSHPLSVEDPVWDTEITCIGHLRLLEAVRDYNPQAVVVYPSSTTVIGKAVGEMIDENHSERPLDIYSANKGVAEKYNRIFHKIFDLKTVMLRFPNLYGPYGKPDPAFGFVNYFIHQVASGIPIDIWGDGQQTRNVLFVDDASEIMWQAAENPRLIGEAYFAVHTDHHSVREVAEAIVSAFGQGSINYLPWPDVRKRIEIEKVMFSGARLHYHTGWRPKYTLLEGLAETRKRMRGAL